MVLFISPWTILYLLFYINLYFSLYKISSNCLPFRFVCLTPLGLSSKGSGEFAWIICVTEIWVLGHIHSSEGPVWHLCCMYIHEQVSRTSDWVITPEGPVWHWAVGTFTSELIWLCVCSLGLPRWRNLVVTGPEESVWTGTGR